MKFKITFKRPDVVQEAIEEAVENTEFGALLTEDEIEAVKAKRIESIGELCSKWFQYGEYVTLEVDTAEESIRVVPVAEEEEKE